MSPYQKADYTTYSRFTQSSFAEWKEMVGTQRAWHTQANKREGIHKKRLAAEEIDQFFLALFV